MNALDVAIYIAGASMVAVWASLSLGGPRPLRILLRSTLTLLFVTLAVEALAKLHLHLPSGMTAIDQATFWVFIGALLLQVTAGVVAVVNEELDYDVSIRDDPRPYSHGGVTGFRGGGSGVLWWFYTHRVRNNLGDGTGGNRYEDVRLYSPPRRPFNLPAREVSAFQRLFRGLSLLSIAVMGIVRFASGEPILNLFGA